MEQTGGFNCSVVRLFWKKLSFSGSFTASGIENAMKSLQVRTEIFMYLYYDHNNYNYNNITMLVCFVLTRVPVLIIPKICH